MCAGKPRLSDSSLRRIVARVIALRLIHQIGALMAGLWGMAWGAVSALMVAGVTLSCIDDSVTPQGVDQP